MKRFLLFITMLFMALGVFAQRAAVMEFKAGVGISQADVDGISAIFITYFRPAGYTMVERTQIDRVIDEQGFQRSRLTETQMVRIGQILNVSKIVIGDVNVVMGQYNVDVRVINVESGTIAATEGATFSGASYRTSMQGVAQKLASKIAIGTGPTVSASSTTSTSSATVTAKKRTTVETVYGYLHVFPNEIGVFQSEPSNVIANINAQKMHGYNDWRLPTNEELSLLRANGYLSGASYMTKESRSGMVLLITTGKTVAEKEASMIAIGTGPTVSASSTTSTSSATVTAKKRTTVETVYGYLHVFPNEIGVFQSEPSNVIANINAQKMHGYNDWRLPTNEELSLLHANGYLSSAQYMSKEKASGMVLLVTTGKSVAEKEAIEAEKQRQAELKRQAELERQRQEKAAKEAARKQKLAPYVNLLNSGVLVDLGLPSVTLWYAGNEGGDYARYTYDEAVSKFGNKLPTKEQLEELKNQCAWTWMGRGYKVVGPNGNSIFFPAAGRRYCNGDVDGVGSDGTYWSSTPYDSKHAYGLYFNSDKVYMFNDLRCCGRSVRLVQD